MESAVIGRAAEGADVDSAGVVVGATWLGLPGVFDLKDVKLEADLLTTRGEGLAGRGFDPGRLAVGECVLETVAAVVVTVVGAATDDTCRGTSVAHGPKGLGLGLGLMLSGLLELGRAGVGRGVHRSAGGRGDGSSRLCCQVCGLSDEVDAVISLCIESAYTLEKNSAQFEFLSLPEGKDISRVDLVGETFEVQVPAAYGCYWQDTDTDSEKII